MTIKSLPTAPAARPRADVSCDLMPKALERWNPAIRAAVEEENSISIFDPIGYDWWTGEGVTAKRISAALRAMKDADVVVNINSPGGDVFEGLAIYNLLREHKGKVTVRVLGLAASAASFIAMAADEVKIARAGFDRQFGARALRRSVRHHLEVPLAEHLLDHHQPGDGNCTTYLASLEHERVRFVRR